MLRASLAILVLCGVLFAALLGQQANSFQAKPIHLTHHRWSCPPAVSRTMCYKTIIKHDKWVFQANKKWHFSKWIMQHHEREYVHAKAHLKKINARLHPVFSYPWWWIPLGVCETGVSPPDPAYGKSGHPGGDGFEGWINFLNSTWLTYGGGQYAAHAYDATEYEQYLVTMKMHADVRWSQSNPACSAQIGM